MIRILHYKLKSSVIALYFKLKSHNPFRKLTTSRIDSKRIPSHEQHISTISPKGHRFLKPYQMLSNNILDSSSIKKKTNYSSLKQYTSPRKQIQTLSNKSTIHQMNSHRDDKNKNKMPLSISTDPLKINNHSRSNTSLEQFYFNQEKYINNHKDKMQALRLQKMQQLESEFTFQPNVNQPLRRTRSLTIDTTDQVPRYIKLNQDAMEHQKKLRQLKSKIQEEEENNMRNNSYKCYYNRSNLTDLPSEIYYEKLYQDAYEYKVRKNENEKKFYADMTFQPKNSSTPNKLKIKTTFQERNQRSIENKKRYQFQKEFEEKEIEKNKKKDRLSNNKIVQNNKNVIDRLYHKHFEKENDQKNKSNDKSPSSSSHNKEPSHLKGKISISSSSDKSPRLTQKTKTEYQTGSQTNHTANNFKSPPIESSNKNEKIKKQELSNAKSDQNVKSNQSSYESKGLKDIINKSNTNA